MILMLLFITSAIAGTVEEDKSLVPRVFNTYCSSCHIDEGKMKDFISEHENSSMIKKIRSGESGMPTYSWLFTDEDLVSLIDYMREIDKK